MLPGTMLRRFSWLALVLGSTFLACGTLAGVGGDDAGPGDGGSVDAGSRADAGSISDAGSSDGGSADAGSDVDAGSTDAGGTDAGSSDASPADGGPTYVPPDPPPLPEYGGTCPALVAGTGAFDSVNTGFPSGGDARDFRLLVPPSYDPARAWPVVFAWHWLNASSRSFVEDGELETATEELGFLAVLPDRLEDAGGTKAYQFDWPFVETWGADKEIAFFEDLLACVAEQYTVDPRQIHGVGVSAGGLWVTYLSGTPAVNRLATITSLSGGLGEDPLGLAWRMEHTPQTHVFPAVVLWGGPTDFLGLDFHQASMRYRDALVAGGHFVVACEHTAGHAMPPMQAPAGRTTKFWALWRFMLDHPYAPPPGVSPYLDAGLPAGFPAWCAIASPDPRSGG